MGKSPLGEIILNYIKEKNLTATVLFKRAGIDKFYGYEITSGTKRPSRDELLRILISLNLSVDEAQETLKSSGYPPLYKDDERDSVILFAIKQGGDVSQIDETLSDMGFDILH